MAPDFDSLLDNAAAALRAIDDSIPTATQISHLRDALRDVRAAVLVLAEHSTMPRRAPELP